MKPKCKICEKNFNVLTKEGLCDSCFKKEYKFWSKRKPAKRWMI